MKKSLIEITVNRLSVLAEIIKENHLTVWCKLENGDVIKRHKKRHQMIHKNKLKEK